ncbi:MAG TPA: papain-like cysteine protease family protein [Candidatus Acidoferrales bacterium]|nr:papain-like cysteine protease family protein [Candidatus Acidoferrales bacterium]
MSNILPITFQGQCNEYWCWAAVASMVSTYYYQSTGKAALSQSQVAEKTLNVPDCSSSPPPTPCLQLWDLCDALQSIGFKPQNNWTADLGIVSQEVQNRRVLGALMYYRKSGILHYLLVNGYEDATGEECVYVADPAGQAWGVPWEVFLNNYNYHDGDAALWKQWILIQT